MFFKKLFGGRRETSAEMAKNRISLQIRYDRAGINPEMFELIKRDIIEAVSKYVEYDPNEVETKLSREDHDKSVLIASIPILGIKRHPRGGNPRK